jgi:hypothetical protein
MVSYGVIASLEKFVCLGKAPPVVALCRDFKKGAKGRLLLLLLDIVRVSAICPRNCEALKHSNRFVLWYVLQI